VFGANAGAGALDSFVSKYTTRHCFDPGGLEKIRSLTLEVAERWDPFGLRSFQLQHWAGLEELKIVSHQQTRRFLLTVVEDILNRWDFAFAITYDSGS
jgi:hypothetical protein